MKDYNKLNKQLYALREENKYLHHDISILQDINSSHYDTIVAKDKENENLQKLMVQNIQVNIIMTEMLKHCDQDTVVGTAFKAAILQYQKVLAERMWSLNNKDKHTDESWNLQTPMN